MWMEAADETTQRASYMCVAVEQFWSYFDSPLRSIQQPFIYIQQHILPLYISR